MAQSAGRHTACFGHDMATKLAESKHVALTKLRWGGVASGRPKGPPLHAAGDPSEDTGTFRFASDQAQGNEDVTRVQCPRCNGAGDIEERTENATGYSIRHTECWLCCGVRMVSPVACAEFRGWAGRRRA